MASFAEKIEARLAESRHEPRWEPADFERYMSTFIPRREEYERQAARLISDVVRPRLETLASYFVNASLANVEPGDRCGCWFGYSERFPVSVKIEFAIDHDREIEHVLVAYTCNINPSYLRYDSQDRLTMPLGALDDGQVSKWVEDRLLEFLEVYLRIDRGETDFEEDIVTDPVCGMRLKRSAAQALDRGGHRYFFCSGNCQQAFLADPQRYIAENTV